MRPTFPIPIAAAFLAAFFMAAPAAAQTVCGERRAVVASLEKTYSETPVSIGLASNGAVIEVLASPSGSFTIILTRPNGLSCVMAAGENWENLPKRLAGSKISYSDMPAPTTWVPGTFVAFRGYCAEMRDAFRLAQLYAADLTAKMAFAYFDAPDNSCREHEVFQAGVLRQRVSRDYVFNLGGLRAHIWRVGTDEGDDVYVIVTEDPRAGRAA